MKTDTNGYLTEAGLVAFYREFGHLGDDIEASGVSTAGTLLDLALHESESMLVQYHVLTSTALVGSHQRICPDMAGLVAPPRCTSDFVFSVIALDDRR